MFKNARWQIRIFFLIWMLYVWIFVKDPFNFILLNTFLGYIPIEIGFHISDTRPKSGFIFWPLTLVWLLFYPNAPYMLTDLFHLAKLQPFTTNVLLRLDSNMWFLFSCLLISTLSLMMLGFWSLTNVSSAITTRLHINNKFSNLFVSIIIMTLSSVGIFIGRFLRLHTIIFMKAPQEYIQPLLNMWNRPMIVFVILLTIVQLVIYWLFILIIQNSKE
ncbi:DUF1361 domain-containing protein [Lactobacillus sp. S2-2]|uniref:DUF1361 domain-containing protein n=1 Tax=Lactobacillus sp. S2-2 TaxID=2692917 RepID=UPI001F29EAC4|nr:DUF1361 domain-containing protein [Lactobacillus sp. S2-2]MCF6515714.1 DUF1361 domain-containing protein [Lactobacillus sp. S2-2]